MELFNKSKAKFVYLVFFTWQYFLVDKFIESLDSEHSEILARSAFSSSYENDFDNSLQQTQNNIIVRNFSEQMSTVLVLSTSEGLKRKLESNSKKAGVASGIVGLAALFGIIVGEIAYYYGSPRQALKRLNHKLRFRFPLSKETWFCKLPVTTESFLKIKSYDVADLKEVGKSVILFQYIPDIKLREILYEFNIKPEEVPHGIVIKVRTLKQKLQRREAFVEAFSHSFLTPRSSFVLPLLYTCRNKSNTLLYMVLPKCKADVSDFVQNEPHNIDLKLAMAEMTYALKLVHDCGLIHRDLKTQNYFVDFDGHVVLADFETLWPAGVKVSNTEFLYTPGYLAPEIDMEKDFNKFDKKTDVFALGIAFKRMYRAIHKYRSKLAVESIVSKVKERQKSFVFKRYRGIDGKDKNLRSTNDHTNKPGKKNIPILSPYGEIIDEEFLKELIRNMIHSDPYKRYDLNSVLSHPFFRDIDWGELENRLRPPFRVLRSEVSEKEKKTFPTKNPLK